MESHFVGAVIGVLGLLLAATLIKPLAERSRIPFPVLLVVAGFGIGLAADHWQLPWRDLASPDLFGDLIMVLLLPTLVFETALGLDARSLVENGRAVLFLAVPGLLVSTLLITLVTGALTGLDWGLALLLGVVLSATDPAAVIAEFRRLGTPRDLNLLVEGESLFNDATTIVLAKLVVVALGAGIALEPMLVRGGIDFLVALGGGALHGWLFGRIAFALIVRLRRDPYVETALTLLLAYGSYLSAEYLFHTSGIVATAVAGLVLAWERPLPVPLRVEHYLGHFWSFLTYAATAIIFLLVGLSARPALVLQGLEAAGGVILGMLLSRSVVIYGLMPIAERLRRYPRKVRLAYRHLLNWGGLRGAVTLALAAGLASREGLEPILPVALVAVLFTIVVQGSTIGRLARWLGLDLPETSDRIAQAESWLAAKAYARRQLDELEQSPFAATGAPRQYAAVLDRESDELRSRLGHWRDAEEGPVGEWKRLLVRGLSLEIGEVYRLFDQGLLPPRSYIQLRQHLTGLVEGIRHDYAPGAMRLADRLPSRWRRLAARLPFARRHERDLARDYLSIWVRLISSGGALGTLEELMGLDRTDPAVREEVTRIYRGWIDALKERLAEIESSHPALALEQQRALVRRLALTAQIRSIEQQAAAGLLSEGDAEAMVDDLSRVLERAPPGNGEGGE